METLYERLAERVTTWRADGYPHEDHPAIAEILEWAGETEEGELRYLRRPQLRALETYWYLRLVEQTPHIFDLYLELFPKEDTQSLLNALGVHERAFAEANYELDQLWERSRTDDDFVRAAPARSAPRDAHARLRQLHPGARDGRGQDRADRRHHRDGVRDGPRTSRRPVRPERAGVRPGQDDPRVAP